MNFRAKSSTSLHVKGFFSFKKQMLKSISIILAVTAILLCFSACGKTEDEIIGKWYDSEGDVLRVQKDGTYNFEGEYGSGTWKILDDETIEFMDFYGMTYDIEIIEDDYGTYIFYHSEKLYKDSYPSDEETQDDDYDYNDSGSILGEDSDTDNNSYSKKLDAFSGISFETSGISPYCTVAINTQKCDELVQQYVTFKTDKETYANGETAIISATLASYTGGETYELRSATMEYKISGMPEYLESLDGVDLTLLKDELADFVVSQKGQATTSNPFDHPIWVISIDSVKEETPSYFSSLKKIKKDMYENNGIYNSFYNIYTVKATNINNEPRTIYVAITANNLVKNPDGSIRWGTNNLGDYDFVCKTSDKSLEDCVTVNIMSQNENYNISKVDIK